MPRALHLPKFPSDNQMRRLWRNSEWRNVDGLWVPAGTEAADRVIVQEQPPGGWVVLLDGTLCLEHDGTAMTWSDQFSAGFDALRMVKNDWHGPAFRFRPSLPWSKHQGFYMRHMTGAYLSGSTGRALRFDETPVVVVREWQWPHTGWGAVVGRDQRHAFQTIGMRMDFVTADEARSAIDKEVGRWKRSDEWRPRRPTARAKSGQPPA